MTLPSLLGMNGNGCDVGCDDHRFIVAVSVAIFVEMHLWWINSELICFCISVNGTSQVIPPMSGEYFVIWLFANLLSSAFHLSSRRLCTSLTSKFILCGDSVWFLSDLDHIFPKFAAHYKEGKTTVPCRPYLFFFFNSFDTVVCEIRLHSFSWVCRPLSTAYFINTRSGSCIIVNWKPKRSSIICALEYCICVR